MFAFEITILHLEEYEKYFGVLHSPTYIWNNKIVDIEFSAIDEFLEQYASGALIIKLLEN